MKDTDSKDYLDKQRRISEEIKRLRKLFTKIDKKTKKAVESLIENAAFMSITLADLQDHMNMHGVTDKYQNGENQWGVKKSPEVEIYNTMIKNYMSAVKQITDLLPKQIPKLEDDGFDEFVINR